MVIPEIHVLNGDMLLDQLLALNTDARFIPFRECLIEGPVAPIQGETFWDIRCQFLRDRYQSTEQEYVQRVQAPMREIGTVAGNYFLWFEHDLFCQINLWWVIRTLAVSDAASAIYLVYPLPETRWNGFGQMNEASFAACLARKKVLSQEDIQLGMQLWDAYRSGQWTRLQKLSKNKSAAFPQLEAVVQAQLDRLLPMPRPEAVLRNIFHEGIENFEAACREFHRRAGVYGFGDAQLKPIWDTLVNEINNRD